MSIMNRPSWDIYYMQLAFSAATRATCPRRSTGAVLVQVGRVIATGYNGAPRGLPHCPTTDKAGHPDCMEHGHCERAVHAEMNAIFACAAGGASTQGATLYCTTFPCHRCIGAIINAGIRTIVFADEYADPSHAKNYHAISYAKAVAAGLEVRAVKFSVDQDGLAQTLSELDLDQPAKA
jgi:dCMP deaminase